MIFNRLQHFFWGFKWINIQLSVLQIIITSTATMSAKSSPSKKMAAQSTSPASSSPDSSLSQWLVATMAGVLANLGGAKTDASDDSYLDVKPPNCLNLEDSPYNSPDNTDTCFQLQFAEMMSTPIDKLKHHRDTHAMCEESPILPNLEIDDSPTGSQEGLDELGVSIDG